MAQCTQICVFFSAHWIIAISNSAVPQHSSIFIHLCIHHNYYRHKSCSFCCPYLFSFHFCWFFCHLLLSQFRLFSFYWSHAIAMFRFFSRLQRLVFQMRYSILYILWQKAHTKRLIVFVDTHSPEKMSSFKFWFSCSFQINFMTFHRFLNTFSVWFE